MAHEYQPIGEPLLDAMGEAAELTENAKITAEAFGAVEQLTIALDRERNDGQHGYISEREKLSKMLRRLALWIDKNPPPPPAPLEDDDDDKD